jgi:integrase
VQALRTYLEKSPTPKHAADRSLVFITKRGLAWDKSDTGKNHANPLSFELKKVLKKLDLYRPGLGYYALRHTFRTVADEARDQVAVDHVMGHARDDMASVYRERIADDRLEAVAAYVRAWLFGKQPEPKPEPAAEPEEEAPRILKLAR